LPARPADRHAEELYNSPATCFVAGSSLTAMNFFPATMTDVGAAAVWRHHTDPRGARPTRAAPHGHNVIVGVRPEHLEDAALIDTYARIRALTSSEVDFVESLGADKYVHFKTKVAVLRRHSWRAAADSGSMRKSFSWQGFSTRQLGTGSDHGAGFDTSKITILTRTPVPTSPLPRAGSNGQAPESPVCTCAPATAAPACE